MGSYFRPSPSCICALGTTHPHILLHSPRGGLFRASWVAGHALVAQRQHDFLEVSLSLDHVFSLPLVTPSNPFCASL